MPPPYGQPGKFQHEQKREHSPKARAYPARHRNAITSPDSLVIHALRRVKIYLEHGILAEYWANQELVDPEIDSMREEGNGRAKR